MPQLGRTPLLLEAPTAQRTVDPRAVTQSSARVVVRQSDVRAPSTGTSKTQSRSPEARSASGEPFTIQLSKSRYPVRPPAKKEQSKSKQDDYKWDFDSGKKDPHEISGEHSIPVDRKHKTGLHHRVATSDGWDAHKILGKIWDRRHETNPRDVEHETHLVKTPSKFGPVTVRTRKPGGAASPTGNKYMLPHDMPGRDHKDPSVRARAWRMTAQAQANSLGNSYTKADPKPGERRSKEPAQVHVVRHKPTGRMETRTTFHGRKFQHPGKDYDVVHTAISEWLARGALLLENLPQPRSTPPVQKDAEIRSRIAQLVKSGAHQAAARLTAQLRAREQMRRSTASLPGLEGKGRLTPASRQAPPPAKHLTPTGRAARRTSQQDYPGGETQMLWTPQSKRPPGHKTQKLRAAPGASTSVLSPPPLKPLDAPEKKQGAKTTRLPKQVAVTSDLLQRAPLLQELVTAGGVFATGLRPGSPLRSHPRDARHIPNPPKKSAVTTADVGHTANTGAWVPDKKKREVKPPKSKIPKRVWDPITKELEAQPSNTGGVLTIARSRTKLLGG